MVELALEPGGTDITLADAIRVRLPECYIEKAMNIDAVRRVAMAVADQVDESLASGGSAVVLGGIARLNLEPLPER